MRINFESLPSRCQICHQSDRFDPATDHCSRCAGLDVPVSCGGKAITWQRIEIDESTRRSLTTGVRCIPSPAEEEARRQQRETLLLLLIGLVTAILSLLFEIVRAAQ